MNLPILTPTQLDAFVRRVFVGLPDSIEMQKADLEVLYVILPENCAGRKAVMEMLTALILRERAQEEFCFTNKPEAK